MIPIHSLEHGTYYYGRCRNAVVARWNGEEGKFYYWREKFGFLSLETIQAAVDCEWCHDAGFHPRKLRPNFYPNHEMPFIHELKGSDGAVYQICNDPTSFDVFRPLERIYERQGLRPIRFEDESTVEKVLREVLPNPGPPEIPHGYLKYIEKITAEVDKVDSKPQGYVLVPPVLWHHIRRLLARLLKFEKIATPIKSDCGPLL